MFAVTLDDGDIPEKTHYLPVCIVAGIFDVCVSAVGLFAVGFLPILWNFRRMELSPYGVFRHNALIKEFRGVFKLRKLNYSTSNQSHPFKVQL